MRSLLLVGDVHGDCGFAERVIGHADRIDPDGATLVLALGDFGYRFAPNFLDIWDRAHRRVGFIRGNHDDTHWLRHRSGCPDLHVTGDDIECGPARVGENLWWLRDGERFALGEDLAVGVLGGGASIDRQYRQAGISWWSDELPSEPAIDALAADGGVDVLLMHQVPAEWVPGVEPLPDDAWATQADDLCRRAVEAADPRLIVHGHYHLHHRTVVDGRMVIGLDMNGAPLDMATLHLTEDTFEALTEGLTG